MAEVVVNGLTAISLMISCASTIYEMQQPMPQVQAWTPAAAACGSVGVIEGLR